MHLDPTGAWCLLRICAVLIAIFLLAIHFTKLKAKVPPFYSWIGAIAIFGGALAFLLPIALNSGFGKDDDGPVLRQLILYTTGGVLGVITLGETHRKNNQEKEKNENDHTRQVHAERRSRYTTAVEQLANEKAAVRLGGIYTLAGLVDEWLADTTLEPKEQQKEGQVIINNLCSYIRSSFPLAEKREVLEKDHTTDGYDGDFTSDRAQLREEQDVRRTIFEEMSKRSSNVSMDKSEEVTVTPGTWSTFEFNFSCAPIFYPLNNLTIEQGNFASTRFYGETDFRDTKFAGDANFSSAAFTRAYFWYSTFAKDAYFSNAFVWNTTFAGKAHFSNTTFNGETHFENITFNGDAYFNNTTFNGATDFRNAGFNGTTSFGEATFTQTADFSRATFTQEADFSEATFTQTADFNETTFTQTADFSEATFSTSSPKFVEISKVLVLEQAFRARFATLPKYQRAHNFAVHEDSRPILLGEAELDGVKYRIPVGTTLFDPNSWDEEKYRYTYVSEIAKPFENSDTEDEKPAE